MIKEFLKYTGIFIFLVLLQVLVLNRIQFSGYVNPYFYVLLILILPFEIPLWSLLFIGFFLGFSIDAFSNTLGMHTSATVFMAFMRPVVLALIAPRDGYEIGTMPRVHYFGFSWYMRYAASLILLHHFFYFYVEAFTFSGFFETFVRVIFSFAFTLLLVLIGQLFVYKK
ncbi:MAG: rod shape-determining protein MreD [Bacteroidetes bacterium GWF2_38_335]|nr:MAG: rod shape-determining protein MreD [Bacteroidetes bacterium GWF2_38_335]OFY77433.1 MAG: rod shape-determining protein MreD [Bacteroidetes bacterium RIFOXYA12_FULL_38_20]HBS87278.1 rod shape-determining protein MreD [Bacteroidales bacterium]